MENGQPIFNMTFNGPIGQQIAHVAHMEVRFDKDMRMHIIAQEEEAACEEVVAPTAPSVREFKRKKGYPQEESKHRYADIVDWLAAEKAEGRDHYKDCSCNMSLLAEYLSNLFDWPVERVPLYNALKRVSL